MRTPLPRPPSLKTCQGKIRGGFRVPWRPTESKGVQAASGSDLLRENRGYNETLEVVRAEKDKAIVRNGRGETRVVFAEGDGDEIRLAFSTHDVTVSGGRLDILLPDIVVQRVTLLREPLRSDAFAVEPGLRVTGVAVMKAE